MTELLRSENLIFLAPLVVGTILFLLLTAISGFEGHGDGDVSHDFHADSDQDHDISHDSEGGDSGHIAAFLGFFGIGKVPLSIVLFSLVIIWGVTGYVMNQVIGYNLVIISVIIAGVLSVFGTRVLARGISKLLPSVETYSQSGLQLWGTEGNVRFTISRSSGTVCLTDRYGNFREVQCRLTEGQEEIPPGTPVVIENYDEISETYEVSVSQSEMISTEVREKE